MLVIYSLHCALRQPLCISFTESRYLDEDQASTGCLENRQLQTAAEMRSPRKRVAPERFRGSEGRRGGASCTSEPAEDETFRSDPSVPPGHAED